MNLLDDPDAPEFLRPRPINIYNQSLNRCVAVPGFLGQFYARFLATDTRAAALFEGIDFERQRRKLQESLYMVILVVSGDDFGMRSLSQIAKKHGAMNIEPALYDVFVDCLLETVAATDPDYTEDVATAWREVLNAAIEFIQIHSK